MIPAILLAVLLVAAGGTAWALLSGSLKPKEPVPDLVGRTRANAASALTADHLRLVVSGHNYSQTVPAGSVVSQQPAPSSKLRQGQSVQVVISDGKPPVDVPNLSNDTLQEAEQVLGSLGLKWTTTSATSMTFPAGAVISNSPDSGQLVPGQSVQLKVSTGKPKVPVPAITTGTETWEQAHAALAQAGLAVVETTKYDNTVPKDDVMSVDPPPGSMVPVGSTVTVVVSKGPHYAVVPPTAHDSVGQAAQVLQSAGFSISGVTGNPLGTVRGTDPAAGQQVLYGSSVVIIAK